MKKLTVIFCLIFALLLHKVVLVAEPDAIDACHKGTSAELDATELVRRVETQYQGNTSHGKTRMTIKTRNYERSLELETWSEGREKFLSKILSPARERGTCTLKVEDDIWNYIPRIDRLIKIPSSLMGDSWMGSHLTNDDLVRDQKVDELYTLTITDQSESQVTIAGEPLADAAVVWGKIIYRINLEKLIPLHVEYYDEDNVKVRTIEFSDARQINERWLPMTMTVVPHDKPEEFTRMQYIEIAFDIELPANLFSIRSLRNR